MVLESHIKDVAVSVMKKLTDKSRIEDLQGKTQFRTNAAMAILPKSNT